MYRTVTVEVGFCYGHRLHGYVGKCANLHGHQGTVHVTFGSDRLDEQGMVVDFGVVKGFIRDWVNENWDHRMMLSQQDPMVEAAIPFDGRIHPVPFNPTAENLAGQIYAEVQTWLAGLPEDVNPTSAELLSVKFWETPTSSVTCHGSGSITVDGVTCGESD